MCFVLLTSRKKQSDLGIPIVVVSKQLGDIIDVKFANADASMQSDFEPPTTSNPT